MRPFTATKWVTSTTLARLLCLACLGLTAAVTKAAPFNPTAQTLHGSWDAAITIQDQGYVMALTFTAEGKLSMVVLDRRPGNLDRILEGTYEHDVAKGALTLKFEGVARQQWQLKWTDKNTFSNGKLTWTRMKLKKK